MKVFPFFAGIVLAVLSAGCGASDVCHVDSDCATPHVCIASVCENPPSDAGDSGAMGPPDGSLDAGGAFDSGQPHDAGTSDAGPLDAGLLTIDEFTEQWETTVCRSFLNCLGLSDAGDSAVSDCVQYSAFNNDALLNSPLLIDEGVDAGKIHYNASLAPACLAALAAGSCTIPIWSEPGVWLLPPGCAGVLAGTVGEGNPCVADVECVSGAFCEPYSADGGCGTCAPINPLCDTDWQCPTGETCNKVDPGEQGSASECGIQTQAGSGEPCDSNPCQPGYFCDADLENAVCVAQGQNSDACPWGGPPGSCALDLTCIPGPPNNEYNGTCVPRAALGQSCDSEFQCFGFSDVLCDLASSTCVEAPSSGPCLDGDTYSGCNGATSYCDTSGSTPVCTHYIVDGDTCSTTADECNQSSTCVPSASGSTVGSCVPNAPAPVCMP